MRSLSEIKVMAIVRLALNRPYTFIYADGRNLGKLFVRFEDRLDASACGEICEQRFRMFREAGSRFKLKILLTRLFRDRNHDISAKSATSAKTPITSQPTSSAFSNT
jgi:hypothetical protein